MSNLPWFVGIRKYLDKVCRKNPLDCMNRAGKYRGKHEIFYNIEISFAKTQKTTHIKKSV
jgi:hypothetical protein